MDPVIGGVVAVIGVLVGIVIGYYKSKAEFAQEYVSKDECDDCSMKKQVEEMKQDLQKGSTDFSTIKKDILIIKVKLGIKSDLEELKAAIIALEAAA